METNEVYRVCNLNWIVYSVCVGTTTNADKKISHIRLRHEYLIFAVAAVNVSSPVIRNFPEEYFMPETGDFEF